MSFQNTAPGFLTFYRSDHSLVFFKYKIFVSKLNNTTLKNSYRTKELKGTKE